MTQQEFFTLFGEIAVRFSNLEFFVGELLNKLIDPDSISGGLLTGEMNLARKVGYIRRLSRFRFARLPEMDKRIAELMSRVETMRNDRNDFIHGLWVFNDASLARDSIQCGDLRWRFQPANSSWSRAQFREWTRTELATRLHGMGELTNDLVDCLQAVGRAEMTTHPWEPET